MSKENIKRIADAITSKTLAESLGVSLHSIKMARWKGAFPASWYLVVKDKCEELGEECSASYFSFKTSSDTAQGKRDE